MLFVLRFFRGAGLFVRVIESLTCSSSLCVQDCDIDCLCGLRDVCVRSIV